MSQLREAAQAVVDELEDWISNGVIADLRAALAQPETEASTEDLRIYDAIAENYAHPPRDEWREEKK